MRCWPVLLVLFAARGAFASATPVMIHQEPPPHVHVVGPAEVRDVRVRVACSSRRILERSASCEVKATFAVAAGGPVTLTALPMAPGHDVIDLGAPGATRGLAAGEVATVTITARRSMSTSWRLRDPYIIPAMVVRHPFLGESKSRQRRGADASVVLASGPELTITGELALDADGDGRVTMDLGRDEVNADERGQPPAERDGLVRDRDATGLVRERRLALAMHLPAIPDASGSVHDGGPLLAAGVREDRFLLRAAWEVGLGERVFVSAAFETDFDSILESLVIDVATPQVLLLPSLRAGTGVVARQYGPRDADVGVRLRAGASLFSTGGDVDFDYWPAIDAWTISATGRLSL